ncbi:hypothetical protein [Streptomyces sp. NPDC059786]|uniref:hypothetical protein n=1 Tax=Streptomyces sp. NPDC059786 TaxID=3346946 RepID=UPI00364EDB40
MKTSSKGLAVALAGAGLLALTACGIPETGVVEAGEPGTGVVPAITAATPATEAPADATVKIVLYFVRDGSLVPVTHVVPGPADPARAVQLLFYGPSARERADGLTTDLPGADAAPTLLTDGATVTVRLPEAVGELSETGIDQLACTAAAARLRQDPDLGPVQVQVTVRQSGGRLAGRSSDSCPGLPDTGRDRGDAIPVVPTPG